MAFLASTRLSDAVWSLAGSTDADALASWVIDRCRAPDGGCLFTWTGQPTSGLRDEIGDSLERGTGRWVMVHDHDRLVAALGCATNDGGHAWLRGPFVDPAFAPEESAWHAVAGELARRLVEAGAFASMSAYPALANARAQAFLRRNGLEPGPVPAHVYVREPNASSEGKGEPLTAPQVASFRALFAGLFPRLTHVADHVTALVPHDHELVRVIPGPGDRVLAFVIARRRPHRGVELVALGVAPDARGCGLGESLVRQVLAWAQDRVELTVLDSAEPAVRLYERVGFVRFGTGIDWTAHAG